MQMEGRPDEVCFLQWLAWHPEALGLSRTQPTFFQSQEEKKKVRCSHAEAQVCEVQCSHTGSPESLQSR